MWHYAENGKAVGPIGEERMHELIREGRIAPSTLVWRPGWADWQTAAAAGLMPKAPPIAQIAPPAAQPPPMAPPPGGTEDKTLPVLSHILGLFTGFLGPLIILLATPDARAKAHARRALNWQLSLILWSVVCIPLFFVFIGAPLMLALAICDWVFCIQAAVKAGNNILWTYPMTIPFSKDDPRA